MTKLTSIALAILALAVGFAAGQNLPYYLNEKTCETFGVGVVDPYGRVYIGHIDLCGYGLEWGRVQGPISKAQEDGKWN